ncbi:glycerophosphodiester phosphodiesterase [Arcobacter sp. YIC-464]|uniref:glycerophosphodiester phosphodiesterase n=1 Tax=Arcobacter sp. YIC-464 TaxID=3376631 RepID=UPI003C284D1B
MNFFNNFNHEKLIIAHRGFRNTYVENSFEALTNSVKDSDFLEFDIQFTKDYIPIIHHDETLLRMSEIEKIEDFKDRYPYYIKNFYFDEIKDIDIRGTKLLKLEDFLVYAYNHHIYFNLEIKDIPQSLRERKAIDIILELIYKYKCEEQVLISAFIHRYLEVIRAKDKTVSLALLCENKQPSNIINRLKKIKAQSYNINKELVEKELIEKLKKEGIKTLVYTVNDSKIIDELFEIGIDGVFTDKAYIKEESKTI